MMRDGWEILADSPMVTRGVRILKAMAHARRSAVVVNSYQGTRKNLLVYGAGAAHRQDIIRQHAANGGRYVCLDLPYWGGEGMRMSVDAMHPKPEHMDMTPTGGRPIPHIRDDYCADGPVIVIGMGRKSRANNPTKGPEWEERKLKDLKDRFPIEKILYREKGELKDVVMWPHSAKDGPIEGCIKGASLVVCKHSNCAIDACIAGIPVECDAGAAYWLYGKHKNPTKAQRLDFLSRVAHWTFALDEAPQCWKSIERHIYG